MQRLIMQSLVAWKDRASRMPLLLRGARQVGKTTVLKLFGEQYFTDMLIINFELQPEYKNCFSDLQPQKIINALAVLSKHKISAGNTLLFLDEIQDCPNAIRSLRYFMELMPDLHVVAAGSLLEFTLRQEDFRMPVGRVESLYLKPISFDEYLLASGYTDLLQQLQTYHIGDELNVAIETKLNQLLREYFVIGGMPAVVKQYIDNNDLQEVNILQAAIMDTYRRDFAKYASGARVNYVQKLFEQSPAMVAQRFRYTDVDAHMQSRDLKPALADLIDAGIINPAYNTAASGLPLNAGIDERKFKLFFLDSGLVKFSNQLDTSVLLQEDLLLLNRGALAEQFVAQELMTFPPSYYPKQLYYWQRDKVGSNAEVDFVVAVGDKIIPIEVKAGKTGSLRSLQVMLDQKNLDFGIRLSLKPLSFRNRVLSIPLYMLSQLERLVSELDYK